MAAHRYWRALKVEACGLGELELSEFHLLSGTSRVDATATLSASVAPATGSVSSLQDDDLSTGAVWPRTALAALVLQWDAGSGGGMDVSDIRLGSGPDPTKFPITLRLQYSDDAATWADLYTLAGLSWPGPRSKTGSFDPTNAWSFSDRNRTFSTLSDDQLVLGTSNATSGKGLVYQTTGKRQFEVTLVTLPAGADFGIGVGTAAANLNNYPGSDANGFAYNRNGNKYNAFAAAAYGATFTSGDVIGVVVDFSVGSLTFYKNGVSQGVAYATNLLGLSLVPFVGMSNGASAMAMTTLKGTGFLFPAAGALDWSGLSLIRRNRLQGRAMPVDPLAIPTGASVAKPFRILGLPLYKGRNDYGANVLGKGIGRVRGQTLDYVPPSNQPYRCLVRLIREIDGLVVRWLWSGADGAYDFQYVDEMQSYTVLAYYVDHGKRAVVSDGLTLANGKVELMP